jgi:acetyl-CoA acetyltransferase
MEEAFIIDGIRTPIGSYQGTLASVRADDLAALVIQKVVEKQPSIPKDAYDDVILGCANQAGEDNRNVARMSLLLAGLPYTVPGETVNRLCSSGLAAIVAASRAIKSGDGHVFIAGGVENMTRGPLVVSKPSSAYGTDSKMYDSSFGWRFVNPKMHSLYGTDAMDFEEVIINGNWNGCCGLVCCLQAACFNDFFDLRFDFCTNSCETF